MASKVTKVTSSSHAVTSLKLARMGSTADLKRIEAARLRQAAEIVADAARRISSTFSHRTAASIKITGGTGGVYIKAGGPAAPMAEPFETGRRHPLFGMTGRKNTKRGKPEEGHWYPQPIRPYLEEAVDETIDEVAAQVEDIMSDWLDALDI